MNVTVLINICGTGITRSGFYTTHYKSPGNDLILVSACLANVSGI